MDETAVSVRGGWHYLYRAVDRHGKSVDSVLRGDGSKEAAQGFFRNAVASLWGNTATHRALRQLGLEDPRWKSVTVRGRRYLNNIVEQDHRAIKQRCASMLGFKSFRTAAVTLAGVELAHRIRKRKFSFGPRSSAAGIVTQAAFGPCVGVTSNRRPKREAHYLRSLHQNSQPNMLTETEVCNFKHVRNARKVSDGGGLNLLIRPNGGRYWRYNYRFEGSREHLR
jgi:hypothetical protein